ncbi:MAG: stage V sporulation protein AD, partial [Desulfitobacterium sp.]|nr:stage V sporulation protein AD [Desulfitobacterium sp.]
MAPAVADTILNHLHDLNRQPEDYDLIIAGDLGSVGLALAKEVLKKEGLNTENLNDCGVIIFDPKKQDVHAGASGCGCSAVVFAGEIMNKLLSGHYRRVLLVGSGALHSPTSSLQGESIPGIGHGVVIEA